MTDLKEVNNIFTRYVCRTSHPVAIKMVTLPDEVAKSARTLTKNLSGPNMHCKGLALARCYGRVIATGLVHCLVEDLSIPIKWGTYIPTVSNLFGRSSDTSYLSMEKPWKP